jgi:hypothetical protein
VDHVSLATLVKINDYKAQSNRNMIDIPGCSERTNFKYSGCGLHGPGTKNCSDWSQGIPLCLTEPTMSSDRDEFGAG